jgi:hypothetical protein
VIGANVELPVSSMEDFMHAARATGARIETLPQPIDVH